MGARADSDEHYVLDLCDQLIGAKCSRQHRFEWLLGDPSPATGRRVALPVDGYWEAEGLVVEFAESQHTESTPYFDKPDVVTVSGVHRGIQRAIYDDRRKRLIPEHGMRLVVISASEFPLKARRIHRDRDRDLEIVSSILEREGVGTAAPRVRDHEQRTREIDLPRVGDALREFVTERDWDRFHSPENLAKSISIEAGELLECFQWNGSADPARIAEELADVMTYCLLLADKLGVDADQIILEKLEITRKKYPADRSRGRSAKYDEL
ncbi:nucleotide pyrophosphohydrolase [Agromyces sp. NPDC004153]